MAIKYLKHSIWDDNILQTVGKGRPKFHNFVEFFALLISTGSKV